MYIKCKIVIITNLNKTLPLCQEIKLITKTLRLWEKVLKEQELKRI